MNIDILTVTALAVAAACSVGLVLAIPVAGVAALNGNPRRMLRATGCALVLALIAFGAFAVLGAGATSMIADS